MKQSDVRILTDLQSVESFGLLHLENCGRKSIELVIRCLEVVLRKIGDGTGQALPMFGGGRAGGSECWKEPSDGAC